MNLNDDRLFVQDEGGGIAPLIWNGATQQATRMYISGNPSTNGWRMTSPNGLPYWSYVQPYVAYTIEEASNNDPTLYSYDFTSTTSQPSRVALEDLANCASALSGVGYGTYAAPVVSGDDQTFGVAESSTSGQGSSGDVYVIVWNRITGCRMWDTATGVVTGSWGATGTVNIGDRFTIHNARLSKDGNWMRVDIAVCNSGGCLSPNDDSYIYLWQISTLNVSIQGEHSGITTAYGGHYANGYTKQLNDGPQSGQPIQEISIRPFAAPGAVSPLLTNSYPVGGGGDEHLSWTNVNSTETNPVLVTQSVGSFIPSQAWDNEVLAYATDGSGTVWRFAHTYATNQDSYNFPASAAIGAVSQDGKWFAWSTDWDGMLGATDSVTRVCAIGANCRADVFMMQLPIQKTLLPPTNLKASID